MRLLARVGCHRPRNEGVTNSTTRGGEPRQRGEDGDANRRRAGVRRRAGYPRGHHCHPFAIIAVFHCSDVSTHFVVRPADLRTLKRSFHLQPEFPAEGVRDDVARRLELAAGAQLVHAERVTDRDRFTVPVAALQDVADMR